MAISQHLLPRTTSHRIVLTVAPAAMDGQAYRDVPGPESRSLDIDRRTRAF